MRALVLYVFCCVANTAPVFGQVIQVKSITSRTVLTTKHRSLDEELLRFLLYTHEADNPTDGRALYQVPLLVTPKYPGVGVYKFGLLSAHLGTNVVFQYRDRLVFSSALRSAPLFTQLRHFLTRYPTAFSAQAQRTVQQQLKDIVEHNQTGGEGEPPPKL